MNIIVVHGEDLASVVARITKFYQTAKDRDWEVIRLNKSSGRKLSEELTQASLFGGERLFSINASDLTNQDLIWLAKENTKQQITLVIYSDTPLTATFLNQLPKSAKTERFDLPKLIFKFLESFYPGNLESCGKLFQILITNTQPEFIFILLSKLARDLVIAKADPKTLSYPTWRISKLSTQSEKFKQETLIVLIAKLAQADILAKTSRRSLVNSLNLLIAETL